MGGEAVAAGAHVNPGARPWEAPTNRASTGPGSRTGPHHHRGTPPILIFPHTYFTNLDLHLHSVLVVSTLENFIIFIVFQITFISCKNKFEQLDRYSLSLIGYIKEVS